MIINNQVIPEAQSEQLEVQLEQSGGRAELPRVQSEQPRVQSEQSRGCSNLNISMQLLGCCMTAVGLPVTAIIFILLKEVNNNLSAALSGSLGGLALTLCGIGLFAAGTYRGSRFTRPAMDTDSSLSVS